MNRLSQLIIVMLNISSSFAAITLNFQKCFVLRRNLKFLNAFINFKRFNKRFNIQIHQLRFDEKNEYINIKFKIYLLKNEIHLTFVIIDNL